MVKASIKKSHTPIKEENQQGIGIWDNNLNHNIIYYWNTIRLFHNQLQASPLENIARELNHLVLFSYIHMVMSFCY